MKFKKILIIIALLAIFAGGIVSNCIDDWYITEKLGNNYVFTSDYGIQYQTGGHDYFVIPFGITSINHDTKWIIAKTTDLNALYKKSQNKCNDGSQYWIIDKDAEIIKIDSVLNSNMMSIKGYEYPIISNGLIGPLDSISFCNKLKELKIRITFKENSK